MVKPPTRATYRSLRGITANGSNFDFAYPNIEMFMFIKNLSESVTSSGLEPTRLRNSTRLLFVIRNVILIQFKI